RNRIFSLVFLPPVIQPLASGLQRLELRCYIELDQLFSDFFSLAGSQPSAQDPAVRLPHLLARLNHADKAEQPQCRQSLHNNSADQMRPPAATSFHCGASKIAFK
ncbi:hypothetical protein RSAG8_08416, partial [Rhizoctonia solani AG-8 WAC10335]